MTVKKIIIAAMALSLAACNNVYPGMEYEQANGNHEQGYYTSIRVGLSPQNLFSLVSTRGTGAFTKENTSLKAKAGLIYVYAFRNDSAVDLTKTMTYGDTLEYGPVSQDCLVDGGKATYGMPSRWDADSTGMLHFVDADLATQKTLYYSQQYNKVGYNFFGYYIDDFKTQAANYHRTANEIYYDLTLDGAQDIMLGSAPVPTYDFLDKVYEELGLSDATKNNIVATKGYSAYSGSRGVIPYIGMGHVLTQLRFYAVAGDSTAADVCIRDIAVTGPNQGKLTVAARNNQNIGFQPNGKKAQLRLRQISDGTEEAPYLGDGEGVRLTWDKQHPDSAVRLGDCIMLATDSTYTLQINYDVYRSQNDPEHPGELLQNAKATYSIQPPKVDQCYDTSSGTYRFMPGYAYDIKIISYGTREIEVKVAVAPWTNSGDINVDMGG